MKKNKTTIGIGERIKKVRGNETIPEFAKKFGVHKSTLVRYEKEETLPKGDFLIRICDMFNINLDWLLKGKEPMKRAPHTEKRLSEEQIKQILIVAVQTIQFFEEKSRKMSSCSFRIALKIAVAHAIDMLAKK